MKTNEIFLTIDQCKYLQVLGLDMSDSAFCWAKCVEGYNEIWVPMNSDYLEEVKKNLDGDLKGFNTSIRASIPTYTLQEVLGKIPTEIKPVGEEKYWLLCDSTTDRELWYKDCSSRIHAMRIGSTFLEAAYKMLCWVLKNGYYEGR